MVAVPREDNVWYMLALTDEGDSRQTCHMRKSALSMKHVNAGQKHRWSLMLVIVHAVPCLCILAHTVIRTFMLDWSSALGRTVVDLELNQSLKFSFMSANACNLKSSVKAPVQFSSKENEHQPMTTL